MLHAPIRFAPYLRPMVWGGRRLGEALNKPLPTAEPYGESWEVSDHTSHRSVVAWSGDQATTLGPAAGKTLRELMEQAPAELLGAGRSRPVFPWLVKFLDARDWLSVQVHPDDESVRALWPGEGGKTEAWFVLDAASTGRVFAGLLPGVDEKRLREALRHGGVADCLHSFRPRPGDCLFLPAGTVHAVGGGVLMAEVQQTSDATFRLYDWDRRDAQGRSRTLHVEEAMACIDWKAGPVHPVRAEGYPDGPAAVRQRLVSCRYFTLDYVRDTRPFRVGGGRMEVLIVAHGHGSLHGGGLRAGDCLLLPAASAPRECRPEGAIGLLLAALP